MRRLYCVAAVMAACALIVAAPASAHEPKRVGKYNFVVGWGDEPTYTGFRNSVQLVLSDATDKPVSDLGDTLKVEVSSGDQKLTLPFEPNFEVGEFGEPGDYRAWLVPTRPGTYTFHITGTIKGDNIDQAFTSGENSFDDVKSVSEVEFPVKDPTTGDLSSRLQRSESRAVSQAKDAKDTADTGKTLGMVGIAVGAFGVILAIAGLARRRG